MSPDSDCVLTCWELNELADSLRAMAIVTCVTYMIYKTKNIPFSSETVIVYVLFEMSMRIFSLKLLHRQEFPLVLLVFTILRLSTRTSFNF